MKKKIKVVVNLYLKVRRTQNSSAKKQADDTSIKPTKISPSRKVNPKSPEDNPDAKDSVNKSQEEVKVSVPSPPANKQEDIVSMEPPAITPSENVDIKSQKNNIVIKEDNPMEIVMQREEESKAVAHTSSVKNKPIRHTKPNVWKVGI